MTRQSKYFVIVIILFSTTSIFSAEKDFYAGFNIGQSLLDPGVGSSGLTVASDTDNGLKIYAGYHLKSNISIEAFWSDLGKATLNNPGGTSAGSIDYSVFGIGGVYYYPINRTGLKAFAKAGLVNISNSSDLSIDRDGSLNLTVGGGIEYDFRDLFTVRAEYDYYSEDAQMIGIGLSRRFSSSMAFGNPFKGIFKKKPRVAKPQKLKIVDGRTVFSANGLNLVLNNAAFTATNAIGPDTKLALDSLIANYAGNPVSRVTVDAYTTHSGNKQQMLLRARKIAQYLYQHGVDKKKLRFSVKPGSSNQVHITAN